MLINYWDCKLLDKEIKMRNLSDVIDQMIKVIPKDHEIIEQLNYIKNGLCYVASEVAFMHWRRCTVILSDYLGKPDTDWKLQVQKIFNGE